MVYIFDTVEIGNYFQDHYELWLNAPDANSINTDVHVFHAVLI